MPKVGTPRPLLFRATCCTPEGPAGWAGGDSRMSLKQLMQLLHPQCAEVAVEARSKHQSVSSRHGLHIFLTAICVHVYTHKHIVRYSYIYTDIIYTHTYKHTNTRVMTTFPRPAWRRNPLFRGGDFHVHRMMTINATVNAWEQ